MSRGLKGMPDQGYVNSAYGGPEMPKMKTRSGAKKRFRFTASGRIKFGAASRRHGMSKRPQKMKRQSRGPNIMSERDQQIVLEYMPYNR